MMKSFVAKATIAASAATVAITAASVPAEALTVYTNRTAWENNLGPGYPIVNEDFSSPKNDAASITFDDYGIVSTGQGGGSPFRFNGIGNDGRYDGGIKRGNPNGQSANYFDSITWTFPEDVKGFFFDYISMEKVIIEGDFDGDGMISASEKIRVKDVGGSTGSFGLIGHSLFSSIKFTIAEAENSAAENFKIDNLSVAVPTPAMLPGLIGMGMAALRRRKGEAEEVEA